MFNPSSDPLLSASVPLSHLLSTPITSTAKFNTPSSSLNIKGLSISVSPSNSTPTPITPTSHAPVSPPGICILSSSPRARALSSSRPSSAIDPRPAKRRRPSPAQKIIHVNAFSNKTATVTTSNKNRSALPTPPSPTTTSSCATSGPASTYQYNIHLLNRNLNSLVIPLTPNTPLAQQDITHRLYMLPATPITPISSLDYIHHSSNNSFQCSSNDTSDSVAASTSAAATAVNTKPSRDKFSNHHVLVHPSSKLGSYMHTLELAANQTVPPTPVSGIFLVAEHRGLVRSRISSLASSNNMFERLGGDGVLAVVPTSTMELKFRTEARVQPSDHFLRCLTNMGGGSHVAVARRHTISWLIELNQQHVLFRYKINTLCVAVQYMDRFLDLLAREGLMMSQRTCLSIIPKIAARNGAPGPFHSATKPAPLAHWRSYDWYLLAIVCLSISAKMVEEYDDPTMRDMVSLDFNAHHIRQVQICVAKTLGFDLGAASPVNFVIEYLSVSPIRDLLAELLPHHRAATRASSGLNRSSQTGNAQVFSSNSPAVQGHGLATPPLSPPPSLNASPSLFQTSTLHPTPQPASDIIIYPAPSADLEQFQGMVTPVILDKVQSVAEQYLLSVLPCPESASFAPSELGMAAINLALEVRSLMVNAVVRVNPVTGARHVDYLPKSLALGFYGTPMTERTNSARDLMLRILPRERFFMHHTAAANSNGSVP